MSQSADSVEIFEVGPRDGLQNEARIIPVEEKVALIDLLSRAGFSRIEIGSFVSPKWVPQMACSGEVAQKITKDPAISYAALVPNMIGYAQAKEANVDEIAIFVSASEGFSKANLNATIDESFARLAPVASAAQSDGIRVRGYVSCVTDCPFDGPLAPVAVADVAQRLVALGCYEISLGDTIGQGTPERVDAMLRAVLSKIAPSKIACHFHDTNGRALDNIDAALDRGIRVFDAAIGGLGGCPYAPGASGNVATEAVATHLERLGHTTGLNIEILNEASALAKEMRHV